MRFHPGILRLPPHRCPDRRVRLAGPLFLLALTLPAFAQSAPPLSSKPNQVRGDEITPAQRNAVDKGLTYLAAHQAKSGGYGYGGVGIGGVGASGGSGGHAGITGLCGLAFMAAGNLPARGKYGDNVSNAVKFVLESCQQNGLVASDQTHGAMYGHGFATLFLGEVYGMTGDDQIKDKLQRAVKLIEKTQNREGGWRYQPWPHDADISVTICEIMALRAARDAGIKVEAEVIENAVKYVKSCQCSDGGFSYMANQGGGSGFARTGAGVAALYYAGAFTDGGIEKGLEFIKLRTAGRGVSDGEGNFFYGNYYATQAMFLAGGDYWAKWYPAVRDQLISMQDKSTGAWTGDVSPDYATAMALIILQMPNRYLPVFHGKGPGS